MCKISESTFLESEPADIFYTFLLFINNKNNCIRMSIIHQFFLVFYRLNGYGHPISFMTVNDDSIAAFFLVHSLQNTRKTSNFCKDTNR